MEHNQKDKYIGQLLDGRYEILELIGVGGMAAAATALVMATANNEPPKVTLLLRR